MSLVRLPNKKETDDGTAIVEILAIDDYVIAEYERNHNPGKIIVVPDTDTVTVKCMAKVGRKGSVWKWPMKSDVGNYGHLEIVRKIDCPQVLPGGRRKIEFFVKELDSIST